MGVQATQPQEPKKSIEHSLLMVLYFIVLCMIGVRFYKDPQDIIGLLTAIGVFGGATTGLFFLADRIKKENQLAQGLVKLLYVALCVLAVKLIWTDIQDIMARKVKDIASIVKTVEDSTQNYAQALSSEDICRDCKEAGREIKKFREKLIDSFLAAKDIHRKDRDAFKLQLDSLLNDPVKEACSFVQYHNEFVRELRILIARQDIQGVDGFLRKYKIVASAKYHILVEGDTMPLGTFRNYIVDVIQGTQIMFRQIYLPPYSRDKIIDKLLLINS